MNALFRHRPRPVRPALLALVVGWCGLAAPAADPAGDPSPATNPPPAAVTPAGSNAPAPATLPDPPAGPTSTNTAPASGTDLASFRLIADRNIFNSSRSPRSAGGAANNARRETRRTPKIETFALVGTLSYEKGTFAFFDGTDSGFRKVLSTGGTIAGHTVREIRGSSVKLEAEGRMVELKVNQQLRREDEGPWEAGERSSATTFTSSSGGSTSTPPGTGGAAGTNETASPAAAPASSGGADDVLQRLLKKREQELK